MTATVNVIGAGRPLHHRELVGRSLCYFLSVTFAGRTFRWCFPSARDIWEEAVDGAQLHFQGMDFPSMSQSFDFDSDSPVDISVSFEDLCFPGDIDLPELLAQGHRLERCEAELSALPDHPDALWSERQIVLVGEVREPVYGDPETHANAVGFTVESPAWEDGALFPPNSWIVTEEEWPDAHESAIGKVYPFVFGQPGGGGNYLQVTPALAIDGGFYMFAGHLVAPATVDYSVYTTQNFTDVTDSNNLIQGIYPAAAPHLATFTNAITGFQYTGASFIGVAGHTFGNEIWSCFWSTQSYALSISDARAIGGYPNFTWDGPLITAGDVLYFMLLQSSLKIDMGRTAVAQALLQSFRLGGYIDEQVTPYDWVVDNLLPILPIAMSQGPKGIFPIVWRFDAGPNDCVGTFIEGPRWRRVSSVERDDSNVFNKYTLSYGLDGSDFKRTFGIDGSLEEPTEDDGGVHVPNLYARRSYFEHGLLEVNETSDIVWNADTAALICAWKIRANALAKRFVTYEASAEHAWLEPGDPILVTDPDLYFTEQLCLVRTKTWDITSVLYELMILTDPARDVVPVVDDTPAFAQLVMDNMTTLGVWMAPEEAAHNDPIADDGVALEEVSGSGEPDILSTNSSSGNHSFVTDDNPTAMFSAVVDMTDAFITEFLAIATALSAKYRCGGIIFKATGLSPGEIALLSVRGTNASPHNDSDGQGRGTAFITDWSGFSNPPPGVTGISGGTVFASAEPYFDGWGASTSYHHLQWRTVGAGAVKVRSYLSVIGGAWASYEAMGTSDTFTTSNDDSNADGISDAIQIGYGGSHDVAVLKIAAVYVGTDDSVSTAALQAIHDGIV